MIGEEQEVESAGHGSHWRQAAIDRGGNGDADGGSRSNAVQCLNSPAVFLAFVEIYEAAPPALWLRR
jgi:hypothetical protein